MSRVQQQVTVPAGSIPVGVGRLLVYCAGGPLSAHVEALMCSLYPGVPVALSVQAYGNESVVVRQLVVPFPPEPLAVVLSGLGVLCGGEVRVDWMDAAGQVWGVCPGE